MKTVAKLAWRNIWRNWRRTLLTSLAVVFGVMFTLFAQCYIKGIFSSFFDDMIRNETAHVKIASKEFLRLERILPKEHLVYDYHNLEESFSSLPGIKSMTERIKFLLVLSHEDNTEACFGVGINPEKEKNYLDLEKYIIRGNYLENSAPEMNIGHKLAQKLGISVGDELLAVTSDINYSTYALTFTVTGIFKTGFPYLDNNFFYIPLNKAQELLDCKGAAHEILLLLENSDKAPKIAEDIQKIIEEKGRGDVLTAVPWQEHYFIKEYMPMAQIIFLSINSIIMLIAALVILNTMLMAVMERTHEIGIIKSMGMKDRTITLMILTESFFIGIIGSAIGGFLGSGLSLYTQKTGIDFTKILSDQIELPISFMSGVFYPKFSSGILITSVLFALASAVIAALYPAIKASRLSPVEALRTSLK
jgi:putative ABC transport system permease protein